MGFFGDIAGSLISGIGKIIGADMESNTAENIAAANQANQMAALQHGVQWKVEDAKRAGIHPLFALGASTGTFTPVSQSVPDWGDALGSMGQGVGRAAGALADEPQRQMLLEGARLDLDHKRISNDIARADLASKLATLSQAGNPPPFPSNSVISPGALLRGGKSEDVRIEPDSRQFMKFGKREPSLSNAPDAQIIENRYGDLVQELYGLGLLGADVFNNVYPPIRRWLSKPRPVERSDRFYSPF